MNLSDIPRCFDRDVLEAWRATGLGWQSRMNDTLRKAMLKP
ncbi:BrnA antitoxin family protein [Pseudomonas sp.]